MKMISIGTDQSSRRQKNLWRAPALYWFLQLLGWGGMVLLEIINYSYFLVGEFSWDYVLIFLQYALAGIIVTHLLRYLLIKISLFTRSSTVIWTTAVVSTVICSLLSVILFLIPHAIINYEQMREAVNGLYFMGLVMNNGRYILMWISIYFLYQVLLQKNLETEASYRSFRAAKNFELELLKKQINPHFLFNALNSIKALVLIDAKKSRSAIIRLSELLRFTLNYENQQLITVEDELSEVQKYFELEKLRYGTRLEVIYQIDKEVLNEFIPSVLILTMAENSIKHGAARTANKVTIEVSARKTSTGFVIEISNPGSLRRKNDYQGIGLRHIQRRLEEHFGNSAVFSLAEENESVTSAIEIRQNEHTNTPDRRRASGFRRAARHAG